MKTASLNVPLNKAPVPCCTENGSWLRLPLPLFSSPESAYATTLRLCSRPFFYLQGKDFSFLIRPLVFQSEHPTVLGSLSIFPGMWILELKNLAVWRGWNCRMLASLELSSRMGGQRDCCPRIAVHRYGLPFECFDLINVAFRFSFRLRLTV